MRRTVALGLVVLVLSLIPVPLPVQAQVDWVIEGNKVYADDANIYLSATPHTLGSSGWVEFELNSKKLKDKIDLFWAFDSKSGVTVNKLQVWTENVSHTKYRIVSKEVVGEKLTTGNITSYQVLDRDTFEGEPDIGNRSNIYVLKVFTGYESFTIACTKYKIDKGVGAFEFNYTIQEQQSSIEYYSDWVDFTGKLTKTKNFVYESYDEWNCVRVKPSIKTGTEYKFRCWVEVPFSEMGHSEGKYIWGVKPAEETLLEAWTSGHLYILDPWWNTQWLYRKKLTFDNSASTENLTNIPVAVSLNSTNFNWNAVQSDGDDIRFADSDGDTLLDYYAESWNYTAEKAIFWVEVLQIDALSTTDSIYIYYGNPTASNGENSAAVYTSDVKLATTYKSSNSTLLNDATSNSYDGTITGAIWNSTLSSGLQVLDFDGSDHINCGNITEINSIAHLTVIGWFKQTVLDVAANFIHKANPAQPTLQNMAMWTQASGIGGFSLCNTKDIYRYFDYSTLVTADEWFHFAMVYDGTLATDATKLKLFYDTTQATLIGSTPVPTTTGTMTSDLIIGKTISLTQGIVGSIALLSFTTSSLSAEEIEARYLIERSLFGLVGDFITYGDVESGIPELITNTTSDVEETSATLSGNITNTSSENCSHRGFSWGLASGDYGWVWGEYGNFGVGEYNHSITSFSEGTLYYYQAFAAGIIDYGYGNEVTFLTKPDEPSGLTATIGYEETNLTWTSGDGADNTTIYGRIGDYPVDRSDNLAVLVYGDTGTSFTHDGLTIGDHWYYRAWSYTATGSWEQWSDTYDQTDLILIGTPTNLTLTDLGATTLSANWTLGVASTYTMLRIRRNYYPTSVSDGELLYYGTGSSENWSGVDLETVTYCVRAWGYHSDNTTHSIEYTDASIGGEGMLAITITVVVLGLTISAFAFKSALLHMVCVIGWLLFGFVMANQTWPANNTYVWIACVLLALSMVIVNLIIVLNHYLGQRTEPPTHDDIQNNYRKKVLDVTRRKEPREW